MNQKERVVLPGHLAKLSGSLYQLQQQGYMCDCIIKTRDGQVNAHRVVLFSSGGQFLQEQICSSNDGCFEINLLNEQYSDVLSLIKLVYTGEVTVDRAGIQNLGRLCTLLRLNDGIQACSSYFQGYQASSDALPTVSDLCIPKTDDVNNTLTTADAIVGGATAHTKTQQDYVTETSLSSGTQLRLDAENSDCRGLKSPKTEKVDIDNSECGGEISLKTESSSACDSYDSLTKLIIHGKTKTNERIKSHNIQGTVPTKAFNKDKIELTSGKNNKDDNCKGKESFKKIKTNANNSRGNTQKSDVTMSKSRPIRVNREQLIPQNNQLTALNFDSENKIVPCMKCRIAKNCTCNKKTEAREIIKREKYKCVVCKETFEDSDALTEHKKQEHSLVCSECCWRTNKGCYLAGHMYAQHGKLYNAEKYPLIQCDHPGCDFKSVKKHAVKVHKTSHTNERHYRCKCGRAFKLKSVYNAHLKSHEPEQLKYECEICKKGFIRPSNLKEHKKIHAENTELCHLCPWSSKSRRELHIHMLRVHNIPVPKHMKVLRCNLCDYYTFTSFLLRNHMDLHSNEKKYQCQICGKFSENESRLKRHLKTHDDTEQIELRCPHEGCGYKTVRKPCLQVHIDAKHSEYKPFQCHLCDYRCKIKGNMDKHLRGTHKMEVMTIRKLWKKVLDTGEGYGSIVHRLKGFKTKGAVGMTNAVDEDEEEDILRSDQIIEQE